MTSVLVVDDERAIVVIEWAEKLGNFVFESTVYRIGLVGDGDDPRQIAVTRLEHKPAASS